MSMPKYLDTQFGSGAAFANSKVDGRIVGALYYSLQDPAWHYQLFIHHDNCPPSVLKSIYDNRSLILRLNPAQNRVRPSGDILGEEGTEAIEELADISAIIVKHSNCPQDVLDSLYDHPDPLHRSVALSAPKTGLDKIYPRLGDIPMQTLFPSNVKLPSLASNPNINLDIQRHILELAKNSPNSVKILSELASNPAASPDILASIYSHLHPEPLTFSRQSFDMVEAGLFANPNIPLDLVYEHFKRAEGNYLYNASALKHSKVKIKTLRSLMHKWTNNAHSHNPNMLQSITEILGNPNWEGYDFEGVIDLIQADPWFTPMLIPVASHPSATEDTLRNIWKYVDGIANGQQSPIIKSGSVWFSYRVKKSLATNPSCPPDLQEKLMQIGGETSSLLFFNPGISPELTATALAEHLSSARKLDKDVLTAIAVSPYTDSDNLCTLAGLLEDSPTIVALAANPNSDVDTLIELIRLYSKSELISNIMHGRKDYDEQLEVLAFLTI